MKEQDKKVLQKILDAMGSNMAYLKERWLDEQGYEDWEDYSNAMRQNLERVHPPAIFVTARKNPFGFRFFLMKDLYSFEVKIKGNKIDCSIVEITD